MKKISSGLQHLVKEMLDDVKHSQTVDIPGDFVSSTFIGHLMVWTVETLRRNEGVHASTKITSNTAPAVLDTGLTRVFADTGRWSTSRIWRTVFTMNLKHFMIRSGFAL
jgi:hypothetical protein